jgi:hypothetical protein
MHEFEYSFLLDIPCTEVKGIATLWSTNYQIENLSQNHKLCELLLTSKKLASNLSHQAY